MKKIVFFMLSVLGGVIPSFSQNAMFASGSFSPSSIAVGETSTATLYFGAQDFIGSYQPGDLVVSISVPEQFYSSSTAPSGTGYQWEKSGNTWVGRNTETISSITGFSLMVTGVSATINGAQSISINVYPQNGTNDINPGDNAGSPSLIVTAAVNTITVTPSTNEPVAPGQPVTFTATGCNGGTYTWTPVGGAISGSNNDTYTVSAANAGTYTYTATCSTGGSATGTFTAIPNTITITTPTSNVITGTPVVLTATGCIGGTYTWNPTGGITSGTNGDTYTVNASQGSVTYQATCSTGGSSSVIITGTPPSIQVTPNITTPVPIGGQVILTATGCNGGTYVWNPSGGTVSGTSNEIYTISALAGSTTYTATCNGGSGSTIVTGQPPVNCPANAGWME